jgi:hypothetical protein
MLLQLHAKPYIKQVKAFEFCISCFVITNQKYEIQCQSIKNLLPLLYINLNIYIFLNIDCI